MMRVRKMVSSFHLDISQMSGTKGGGKEKPKTIKHHVVNVFSLFDGEFGHSLPKFFFFSFIQIYYFFFNNTLSLFLFDLRLFQLGSFTSILDFCPAICYKPIPPNLVRCAVTEMLNYQ